MDDNPTQRPDRLKKMLALKRRIGQVKAEIQELLDLEDWRLFVEGDDDEDDEV